jgi:uncharacterized cupredoxin-like copper-binding protein
MAEKGHSPEAKWSGPLLAGAMIRFSHLVTMCAPVFLVLSCGNVAENGAKISGDLSEWSIKMDETTTSAGDLTFRITNSGTIDHEFLIVKTNLSDGAIPVMGGLFAEDQEGIQVIDEIPQFSAGRTEELTVNLEAGQYQLVCNLPGHYQAGMHTNFIVK